MKRTLEIVPGKSVGPIAFGMTQRQVRAVLGRSGHTFEKTPLESSPAESFGSVGLTVHYSPGVKKVVAIEVSPPGVATLRGKDLLRMNAKQLRSHLRGRLLDYDAGFTAVDELLSAYCPEEYLRKTAQVESVCFAASVEHLAS